MGDEGERLLCRLLQLIRDNYTRADKASFFLERRAGISNSAAIANLRDVLSHLATFLDRNTPKDRLSAQIENAEEHLRRALIEPYEIALADLTDRFRQLYEKYKTRLLPVREKHAALNSAPNKIQVEAALGEINDLALKGKTAKGKNMWDADWEGGVQGFAEAYDKLASLNSELEEFWNKYEQIGRDRKYKWLAIWSITATVLLGILGVIVTYILWKR